MRSPGELDAKERASERAHGLGATTEIAEHWRGARRASSEKSAMRRMCHGMEPK
jgi:hypothetical protein